MASIIVLNQPWAEGVLSINIICDAFYKLLIISLLNGVNNYINRFVGIILWASIKVP